VEAGIRSTPLHEFGVGAALANLAILEDEDFGDIKISVKHSSPKVMIEAYRQDAEGTIDLKTMVTLRKADQVPGSGILTQLSPGLTLSRRDAVRLMIALSDNTATNLVLDAIGIGATAEAIRRAEDRELFAATVAEVGDRLDGDGEATVNHGGYPYS